MFCAKKVTKLPDLTVVTFDVISAKTPKKGKKGHLIFKKACKHMNTGEEMEMAAPPRLLRELNR